ncbi:MAG: type II toxin-antitoxin system HicA family toxin [Candidatus Bathyarchaeota archaeon]|nr:type II toxin-antitoxin system HicA family toxin [Candidatus Bathyarchaeota archaeon]
MRALQKVGFRPVRQRGSHILLSDNGNIVAVPRHDEIKPGTLLSIIDQAKLTREEFLKLLK